VSPEEAERLISEMEALANENNELHRAIKRAGFSVDANAARDIRLELLIDTLLGQGESSSARVKFELQAQKMMNKGLKKVQKDIEKQKTIRKLHVPGRRPNGEKP
jgi:hypothetical protein